MSATPGSATDDVGLRRLAVRLLNAFALAALLAAVTVFLLALLVYLDQSSPQRDWPGLAWFGVLPLLVVALSLATAAWRLEPAPPSAPVDHWG